MLLRFVVCTILLTYIASGQNTPETREIRLPAGQSADIWMGVNVSGNIYYAIRSRDGKDQLRMWWVLQPLGRIKQLGPRTGNGKIDIPSLNNGVVSAKLRAKADVDTVIYISEKVAVAGSIKFSWP